MMAQSLRIAAVFALASALITTAAAQPNRPRGGGPAPAARAAPAARPVPMARPAAPAFHAAAPRVAAPAFQAAVPHPSARVAMPRQVPRSAGPPAMAARHAPSPQIGRGSRQAGDAVREQSRRNLETGRAPRGPVRTATPPIAAPSLRENARNRAPNNQPARKNAA